MRHYCTLFDSAYAAKGLALHASLLKHSSEDFMLHVLCMDKETFWLLAEMELPHVELIPLESFEKALKLQPVRESRSWQEYCWTCASSLMELLLPLYDGITYLDADLYFFSDPKVIHEEVADKSIGITPHRFNEKDRKRLGANGSFNVGVVYAANTYTGRDCIAKWAEQCRHWCFNRNEAGKFGDQAYLDSWPKDYPGEVCVIEDPGVNLGPWAVGNYRIWDCGSYESGPTVWVGNLWTGTSSELICYHMHEYKNATQLTGWKLRPEDIELIYSPYNFAIQTATRKVIDARRAVDARRELAVLESSRA